MPCYNKYIIQEMQQCAQSFLYQVLLVKQNAAASTSPADELDVTNHTYFLTW